MIGEEKLEEITKNTHKEAVLPIKESKAIAVTLMEIQEGWTWKIDNNYSYIWGRVKNTGTTVIRYFEVAATYKDDQGNVLDTDYTNSGETLRPGWSKEFEIMHKNSPHYRTVAIRVQDVTPN